MLYKKTIIVALALISLGLAQTENPLPPGNVHWDGDHVYGTLIPWPDTVEVHDTVPVYVPAPYPVPSPPDTVIQFDTIRVPEPYPVPSPPETVTVIQIDTFLVFKKRLRVEAD